MAARPVSAAARKGMKMSGGGAGIGERYHRPGFDGDIIRVGRLGHQNRDSERTKDRRLHSAAESIERRQSQHHNLSHRT